MRSNRVITVAILLGVVIVAVTFLGAAKTTGDDLSGKDDPKILSPVKNGSKGVVVFGNVDIDNGPGLLLLFPDTFPQPCKVVKVFAKEGDEVKKDDVLLELDTELADLTVKEAQIGVSRAQAIQRQAEAGVKVADQAIQAHRFVVETQTKTLLSKASELDAARIELDEEKRKLKDELKVLDDPKVKAATKKLEAASEALEAERIKLDGMRKIGPENQKEKAEAGLAEAKDGVASQKVQLERALYGQRLMKLKAPADGKIVRSQVTDGMSFGAQSKMPAFYLQPKGPLIVRTEVDQEFASRVAKGQDATILDDGNPNLKWKGRVIRVSDSFLPKRSNASVPDGLLLNEARILECIVSVENVDSQVPLRVGQRVKVSIGVE